jgi:hypothetical protein
MMHVYQSIPDRWCLGKDPQPREGIGSVVTGEDSFRNRRATHAVKPVATRHDIAADFVFICLTYAAHNGMGRVKVVKADVAALEPDVAPVGETARYEVLNHLVLAVDGDVLSGKFL